MPEQLYLCTRRLRYVPYRKLRRVLTEDNHEMRPSGLVTQMVRGIDENGREGWVSLVAPPRNRLSPLRLFDAVVQRALDRVSVAAGAPPDIPTSRGLPLTDPRTRMQGWVPPNR